MACALCEEKGVSKTALIRQALRLYKSVDERLAPGCKVFVESANKAEKAELMGALDCLCLIEQPSMFGQSPSAGTHWICTTSLLFLEQGRGQSRVAEALTRSNIALRASHA